MKCIEDEIPFEVPEGWEWVRLGTISNIVTGRLDANTQTTDGDYPFFTCGEDVFKTDSYAFDCDAILLGGNNATGDFKMHRYSGKFNAYQRVYVISTCLEIDMDYLYNHIHYYLPTLQSLSIGSQTRYLKLGMVTDLLIALPPLNEQKKISLLSNRYLQYCELISIEKYDLSNLIKITKSKILDLAIRGKLVPQDPNDEPASVLLERIRAEKEELIKQGKIKRDKKESIIFRGADNSYYETFNGKTICIDDELPFELPEGWEWSRLGSLALYKKGPFGSSLTKAMFVPNSPSAVKIYEQKNAINKDATLGGYYISEEKYESLRGFEVFPNDIIVSCAGTIGESYVMPSNIRKGIINQALMKISLFDLNILDFYLLYFDFKLKESAQEHSHGIALKNIPPFDVIKHYLIPIPPLNEQQRIIEQIKKLVNKLEIISNALS